MATMEHKMQAFIEDWQGKFMNDYLQPTLETQYDKIRESLNRKLQVNPAQAQTNYFTTVDSGDEDAASDRPTSIKMAPRKVQYESKKIPAFGRRHIKQKSSNCNFAQAHLRGLSATGEMNCDVDLKMSTMEKQLDEKALKLKMLREELQIMASDTISQPGCGVGAQPEDDSDLRLSQTQRVSSRRNEMPL